MRSVDHGYCHRVGGVLSGRGATDDPYVTCAADAGGNLADKYQAAGGVRYPAGSQPRVWFNKQRPDAVGARWKVQLIAVTGNEVRFYGRRMAMHSDHASVEFPRFGGQG